ncbi:glycine--tRNA ligase subunit beta [Pleionea litopenaei]|uniref:Glycine--tRNA ligase beta subunit n=1 Tax=Pleionea litopenaei TaxID=3070815 RepID=A0AA51RR80_9GAMM|nr:glycine--tRNA ligase subunit beta [Pleionea sp. HL-JVS1]WMS86053.1 glycine--tRNA ligase subunit beta [Pleionea sp. HL-JVS1]
MTQSRDLLIELGTEELPPKALKALASAFHDGFIQKLKELELSYVDSEWMATPRRLAIRVFELDTQQQDKIQDRQGPAVAAAFNADGSPKPAAVGFAKSCGVEVDDLERVSTPKGERLAFQLTVKGQATSELIPEAIEYALSKLPIPKAMRWGNGDHEFIRVPHWLLILFGEEVPQATIFDLTASNQSFGHRFHAPQAITIENPKSYDEQLANAYVDVSFASRKAKIRNQVESIAQTLNATPVVDEDLLEEVAALVEWPVALQGGFDETFLEVPAEALIATMQADQKYFHLVDEKQKLLPYFITVSNIESTRPQSVIDGNEKVIRPRLSDAKFFYEADKKHRLDSYSEKLKNIIFQKKLGSLFDKTQRVKAVASELAAPLQGNVEDIQRAADLCKSDLMTNMVYEFPELQGIMGSYYAKNDGENEQVCKAMNEIYQPRFAGDQLPSSATGSALSIADRLDTLVGIFGIGQPPTGAKDPFALRRSAVGLIRILTEKKINLDLKPLVNSSIGSYQGIELTEETCSQVLSFIEGRMNAWYLERGYSAQVLQSVFALKLTNPYDIQQRIEAVNHFNQLDDSEALAAANKRVGNILSKADIDVQQNRVDAQLFEQEEERALFDQLETITEEVQQLVAQSQYQSALTMLAKLREPVDAFFDHVMVNAEDTKVRSNRLALLNALHSLFLSIADISLLQK